MKRCLELKRQYNLSLSSFALLLFLKESATKGQPLIFSDKEVARELSITENAVRNNREQLLRHKLITYTSKGGRGNKGEYTLTLPKSQMLPQQEVGFDNEPIKVISKDVMETLKLESEKLSQELLDMILIDIAAVLSLSKDPKHYN